MNTFCMVQIFYNEYVLFSQSVRAAILPVVKKKKPQYYEKDSHMDRNTLFFNFLFVPGEEPLGE